MYLTVTIQRSTTDRFNDKTYSDHHDVAGCLEYENTSTEVGNAVTDIRTLLTPPDPDPDIRPSDRVKYPNGLIYQVEGLPKVWENPLTGWTPGVEVHLRRVT